MIFHGVATCKLSSKQWIGARSSPQKQIKELRERIDCLSKGEVTSRSKEEISIMRVELEHIYMDEEIYWRQRANNQWVF